MTSMPTPGIEPQGTAPEAMDEAGDLGAAAAEFARREARADEPLDPVEVVRLRLAVEDEVPDVTIASSLAQIASRSDPRERWLAAFGSPLGRHLARRGGDLNLVLDVLLGLVPKSVN